MAEAKKARKKCTTPGCAGQGTEVRTEVEDCIMCHKPLSSADSLADLFGTSDNPIADVLGDLFKRPR